MTKTIKQLYDEGQRQFPMRGGGVSPRVLFTPNGQTIICEPQGYLIHETWRGDGYYYRDKTESCFDLLPIHLPDYQARYEALVKAWKEFKDLTTSYAFADDDLGLIEHTPQFCNLAAAIRGE